MSFNIIILRDLQKKVFLFWGDIEQIYEKRRCFLCKWEILGLKGSAKGIFSCYNCHKVKQP